MRAQNLVSYGKEYELIYLKSSPTKRVDYLIKGRELKIVEKKFPTDSEKMSFGDFSFISIKLYAIFFLFCISFPCYM